MAFSSADKTIFTGSFDKMVRVWDTETEKTLLEVKYTRPVY